MVCHPASQAVSGSSSTSNKQLPVTAGAPTLSVDGRDLGPATESTDGRSLSLVTTDPSVVGASSVTTDAFGSKPSSTPTLVPQQAEPKITSKLLQADPSTPGAHHVAEAVYDFGDQAIPLLNMGGIRGELEGKIYLPDGARRQARRDLRARSSLRLLRPWHAQPGELAEHFLAGQY